MSAITRKKRRKIFWYTSVERRTSVTTFQSSVAVGKWFIVGSTGAMSRRGGRRPFEPSAQASRRADRRAEKRAQALGGLVGWSASWGGEGEAAERDETFFLPNPSPSNGSRPVGDGSGLASSQSDSVRQQMLNLRHKVESGLVQGARLELMDLQSAKCVVVCETMDQGKSEKVQDERDAIEDEIPGGLVVRVLVSYNYKEGGPQFAIAPRDLSASRSSNFDQMLNLLQEDVARFTEKTRRGTFPAELVLKFIVKNLNQELRAIRDGERNYHRSESPLLEGQLQRSFRPLPGMGTSGRSMVLSAEGGSSSSLGSVLAESTQKSLDGIPGSNKSLAGTRIAQPCPRYTGACFSGPGLLVVYDSGMKARLQISSPRMSRRSALTPRRSLPSRSFLDREREKAAKIDLQQDVPRTYAALLSILLGKDDYVSGIEKGTETRVSLLPEVSTGETIGILRRKQNVDHGIPEELTNEDLLDWQFRREPNEGGEEVFHLGGWNGGPGEPGNERRHSIDIETTEIIRNKMQRTVQVLDLTLLTPVHRFIGRAARIGTLEAVESMVHRIRAEAAELDERASVSEESEDEEDSESENESFETLLCWWDSLSDEPTEKYRRLPLGLANMVMSKKVGRFDLVQMWLAISLVSHSKIAIHEKTLSQLGISIDCIGVGEKWALHPAGRDFIRKLFQQYETLRDVQTLALLSCVLDEEARNTSWTSTLPLRDDAFIDQCDRYRRAYAEIAHRWGLNTHRTEVMKLVKEAEQEFNRETLTFAATCATCKEKPAELRSCQKRSCRGTAVHLNCVICDVGVRGLCTFCPDCGHGGHAHHMNSWFKISDFCPTGCGCKCGAYL